MKKKDLIVVRGAGDLATGTIHRLKKAGFRLLVLEAEHPAAIRRQVALSEAVYAGSARVEDVEAVRMDVDLAEKKNRKELLEQEMERIWKKDGVPVLVDPAGLSIAALRPAVVVDAIPAMHRALSEIVKQFCSSSFRGSMSAILNPFVTG